MALRDLRDPTSPSQVFDHIRDISILDPYSMPDNVNWRLLDLRVCHHAFARLWGLGRDRINRIKRAVVLGERAPPADLRYLRQPCSRPSEAKAEAISFLQQLYDSVAETLPEALPGDGVELAFATANPTAIDGEVDPYSLEAQRSQRSAGSTVQTRRAGRPPLARQRRGPPEARREPPPQDAGGDVRYLPPGTMFEYWTQMSVTAGGRASCSFKTFWRAWREHFVSRLRFRTCRQHASCAVCVRHKLMVQSLAQNTSARQAQLHQYHAHLRRQYWDRTVYWQMRGQARLKPPLVLCCIIDGMDQSKFCCPKSELFALSKEFSSFQRPRLHISGLIMHGWFVLVSVSDSDLPKDSSATIELLASGLQRVRDLGLDTTNVELYIQCDNTSRENKNNPMLKWLSLLTMTRRIKRGCIRFLQTGHSHEDIDQLWGRLAAWIAKRQTLEHPMAFIQTIQEFLNQLGRPHEPSGFVVKVDQVRNWRDWLATFPMRLEGIGGPGAPHEFLFERVEDVPGRLA